MGAPRGRAAQTVESARTRPRGVPLSGTAGPRPGPALVGPLPSDPGGTPPRRRAQCHRGPPPGPNYLGSDRKLESARCHGGSGTGRLSGGPQARRVRFPGRPPDPVTMTE
eukprot:752288-Hanusia_phi.AAC.3